MNYDDPRNAVKRRRKLARTRNADNPGSGPAFHSGDRSHGVNVADVESLEQARRRGRGRRTRQATLYTLGTMKSPASEIARSITEALDPNKAPKKVEALSQMSEEKRAEMMRLYAKPSTK